jgi:hypothetical protein
MQYVFAPFYYWEAEWGAGVIFLLIIGIFMYYVVREPKSREEKK